MFVILVLNIGDFEVKLMVEYLTKYPKTVSFLGVICGSLKGMVNIEKGSRVEQLHVVVKKKCGWIV